MEEQNAKFPSKVKVINMKVKVIMDLEGAFLGLEGAVLHTLPKSGGPWPLWPPAPKSPQAHLRMKV